MRAGDIVRINFGTPARGEPDVARPGVVVTSDDVLDFRQNAVVVVPYSTPQRGGPTEVDIPGFSTAQANPPT